ncbi:MAG: ATP synthase F1 subunit epsilon [Anaerolineales bacterium]|jgi:F-type H+-transporting ATPase subunit epsilon
MSIRCEIVSQDNLVFEGDADMVILPGINGEMGILPNHAPLLSTLGMGVIKIRAGNQEEIFTVTGGIVDVQPDIVTILADAAENIEDIDIARAEEAKRRAEELLTQPPEEDLDEYLALEAAIRRSNLRLNSVKRYRSGVERYARIEKPPEKEDKE